MSDNKKPMSAAGEEAYLALRMELGTGLPYVPPTPSPLLQEEVEIAAKLASQYPKIHHHAVGWRGLDDHVVFTDVDDFRAKTTLLTISPDAWCTMEHRHCACGSTLMVITAINDLEPWERTGGFHD